MRLVVPVLALLALLSPLAAARPDVPDVRDGELRAGECVVRWGMIWPGEHLGATCTSNGATLVAFSHGSCALGQYWYVQVGNAYASVPCDPWVVVLA